MNQVPEFWRTEVFHPLSVHFPIALLIFATLTFVTAFFLKGRLKKVWLTMTKVLLIVGSLSAWIGIFTGNLADGEVSREICDPTILKDHEISAYTSSIIFSAATVLLLLSTLSIVSKIRHVLFYLILLSLLTGCGFLMYAGHLGATLVYQQGAGVYHPSEDCIEFSD